MGIVFSCEHCCNFSNGFDCDTCTNQDKFSNVAKMLDKILSKIKEMFKSGFCIRRVIRSRRHNYLQTGNTISDEITVKYHDGRVQGWNVLQYLYRCDKCGKHKYFSEKWGEKEMKYFNKCKRGDCV